MEVSSPVVAHLAALLARLFSGLGIAIGQNAAIMIALIVFFVILSIIVSAASYLLGWVERKFIGRAQARHGPTYVGRFGFLQNLADLVKLLAKEFIVPDRADRPLFQMVLPVVVAIEILVLVFIPMAPGFIGISTPIGMFAVFVLLSFSPLLLFLAGWTSGNKFGSISAQRSVVMMVSYEIPMFIVIASVAAVSGGFGFLSVVGSQAHLWNVVRMPIGFAVFFVALLAELERGPFDLREADIELISGWLTDVNAPYYALALLLDYTRMFLGALLISVMFLGGWLGLPLIPPIVTLLVKVALVSLFIMLVRVTVVRMRIDRVIRLGWVYLTPLAALSLLLTFIIFVR